MRHFTDIELHRWRESGPGDDRSRVVEHLAVCADCARRYAAAIRTRPLHAEPEPDVDDFIAAGRRARPRPRWIVPLAAAILIAIIAIPLEMRRSEPVPELHLRGGGVQTFTPEGVVGRNAQFVWSSGIVAARFRIAVRDANGPVYTSEAKQSPLPLPESLRPGVEYGWTVTALDAQGRPLLTSLRRTFTITK